MVISNSFCAFDTGIQICLRGEADDAFAAQANAAFAWAKDACDQREQLWSRFIPCSEVSLINKSRAQAVPISEETAHLLLASLRYCERSEGVFDITIGAANQNWDFHAGVIPHHEQSSRASQHVNWRNLSVFQKKQQWYAQLKDPKAQIDLGGIAKGWIADVLGQNFLKMGLHDFLINLGGNILVHGLNDELKPWRIAIGEPTNQNLHRITVQLENVSIVTSGTYQRFFTKNDTIYHHILNPKTGFPVESDLVSASIVCEHSLDAEGFSTTVLALGAEAGLQFCREQPEILLAFLIDKDDQIHHVDCLKQHSGAREEYQLKKQKRPHATCQTHSD